MLPVDLTDVIDGTDSGVPQCRRGTSLPVKPGQNIRVQFRSELRNLQSDLTIQLLVESQIDRSHATATEFPEDAISTELRARSVVSDPHMHFRRLTAFHNRLVRRATIFSRQSGTADRSRLVQALVETGGWITAARLKPEMSLQFVSNVRVVGDQLFRVDWKVTVPSVFKLGKSLTHPLLTRGRVAGLWHDATFLRFGGRS